MQIQQGAIFIIGKAPWVVVDHFHNSSDQYTSLHCAPVLTTPELRLDLDVDLTFEGGFACLGLMQKHPKVSLQKPVGMTHLTEVREIRRNLVTWFSVFSFDYDTIRRLPPSPDEPTSVYPGMVSTCSGQRICVIDHWGCYNEYPLLYVAPVVGHLSKQCPLDVDISSEFRDLFSERYYVRTDDMFLVDREALEHSFSPHTPMLGYGLTRQITRALILKFGQISLLL